jgi:hypothetical protein
MARVTRSDLTADNMPKEKSTRKAAEKPRVQRRKKGKLLRSEIHI